ncbi:uncharacterized protein LACBIDRAFT_313402 [Laccaria bicolor S238N-H82]|uniref:Predicted protein n=1 Tax=Laccaria bicolor (strain S238N-H82 / ATCC MYA-4686) TaxID=486041 RepID=B0DY86_LACBS|nr:uncharacterized protein LACBIDRAFT_313402 [Laccaria bicolor S238N-H82]EDR00481.1 predicted protein [Laccaria bicolor S238N-H82]|eukprot:XP_001888873.1 predicted protein [Laccaria bicolor S238N-H82]
MHFFLEPKSVCLMLVRSILECFNRCRILDGWRPATNNGCVIQVGRTVPSPGHRQQRVSRNAGISDIGTAIIAKENGRFVLHDSQGFEHGEGDNFKKVIDFLKARKDMPNVRDQVHAVWLCFQVSLSEGDRLFEAGVEELFRMKSKGELGPVPVITVFTKYDKLVEQIEFGNNLEFHKRNKHLDRESRNARLPEETRAKFQELCLGPFEKSVNKDIPHIAVSTNKEYKDTRKMLNELVRLTADCVKNSLAVDRCCAGLRHRPTRESGCED